MQKEKEISGSKKKLALQTTIELGAVLKGTLSDRLSEGFVDLFEDIPNQHLHRFIGLLAGITPEGE